MKSKIIVSIFLCLFFLISACQEKEKEKSGDYSGVSELIAGRNKARYAAKEEGKTNQKRVRKSASQQGVPQSAKKTKKDLASVILYEQKVKIVGSESNRVMAKGVAYINKKGQIVRIKILKE